MRKELQLLVAASVVLTSCQPLAPKQPDVQVTSTPQNTLTVEPPTPVFTATPYETLTPEPTATKEVQFSVCPIEQYKDCKIPAESLFNGDYLKWLQTLPVKFDSPIMKKDVPIVYMDNGWIVYQMQTSPNFAKPGTETFNRNVTFGLTEYMGHRYLVMPVAFYNAATPDVPQWVVTVQPLYFENRDISDSEIEGVIDTWKNKMHVPVLLDGDLPDFSTKHDPLVAKTLAKYPDLKDLINTFVDYGDYVGKHPGDRSALSKPGLILLNLIETTTGGKPHPWFQ